ncbi:hypothetical protein BH20ACT3_BH20ACT3_04740 [soil metagenome]
MWSCDGSDILVLSDRKLSSLSGGVTDLALPDAELRFPGRPVPGPQPGSPAGNLPPRRRILLT